jgi:hypothetical protein
MKYIKQFERLDSINDFFDTNDYDFKGELKIVDDKLIKDTLPADMEKYNL